MKKIIYIFGMIIISATICFAQDEENQEPLMVPAWDIHLTCTDFPPDYCPAEYFEVFAYATVDGVFKSRERRAFRRPDGVYFVVFDMGGMPSHDSNGNIVNYTIMAASGCSQTVKPYPTGSVAVYITGHARPC
ncbi:MAG: hypothetical protein Q8K98_14575 [Bacteroidota bacterium]|nr:hypothetical protein [Bacteroidota bacterium]